MFFLQSLVSFLSAFQHLSPTPAWNDQSESQKTTLPQQEFRPPLYTDAPRIKVSLPVDHPTESFWTIGDSNANPLSTEGSQGPLSDNVDIAIIGSGITGIGAAYHLSQSMALLNRPLKIAVLEARSGATGRNGGHLTPIVFQDFYQNRLKYGNTEALRFLALENHTVDATLSFIQQEQIANEVDLVHGPHVKFLLSHREEDSLRVDFQTAAASHVDLTSVQFLSNLETRTNYGPDYPSVEYFGRNVWPLKLVTKLFMAARKKIQAMTDGSELILHTHTPVLDIITFNSDDDDKTLVKRWKLTTPRGDIYTHIVVHATNAYAGYLLPFLEPGASIRSITPTRGQVIATRASISADRFKKGNYDANDGFEYWFSRPVPNSSVDEPLIILGGGRESSTPGYEVGITDDSNINFKVSEYLRRFLPRIYPEGWFNKNVEPEMEWTGIMGFTQTSLPVVGPVLNYTDGALLEGQYIAAGYTGHGMPRAYGCAEALVQMILSDLQYQRWNPPNWFPRNYLTFTDIVPSTPLGSTLVAQLRQPRDCDKAGSS